jgi:hypothetical protein
MGSRRRPDAVLQRLEIESRLSFADESNSGWLILNWRNQAWLLKNSKFQKLGEIWGIENEMYSRAEKVVCRAS